MPEITELTIRAWLETFVVDLNLCPFARPVVASRALRIAVCEAQEVDALTRAFLTELDLIQAHSEQEIATTLLAMPRALGEFEQYLMFLEHAETLLSELGLEGTFQLASFHPHYRFAGEPADSMGSYTNRSPYPMIHFLREDMLTRVLGEFPDPHRIPDRNIATLEAIGRAEILRRWNGLGADSNR